NVRAMIGSLRRPISISFLTRAANACGMRRWLGAHAIFEACAFPIEEGLQARYRCKRLGATCPDCFFDQGQESAAQRRPTRPVMIDDAAKNDRTRHDDRCLMVG